MGVLHDENEIGPAEQLFGDTAACGGADASAGDLDTRVILVDGLGGGAAPLVAGAEEEDAKGLARAWVLAGARHMDMVRARGEEVKGAHPRLGLSRGCLIKQIAVRLALRHHCRIRPCF